MKTKKDIKIINESIVILKKAKNFILREDVHFCLETNCKNSETYINREDKGLNSIIKEYGSELCYLYKAIDSLELLINPKEKEG